MSLQFKKICDSVIVGGPVVYSLKRIVGLSHFLCALNILRRHSEMVAFRTLFVDLSTMKFIVHQATPVPSTHVCPLVLPVC